MIDNTLFAYMDENLRHVPESFKRYLYERIDWDARMIGIIGPRGVGKSTMILQQIKERANAGLQLYVSADHTYFSNHSIAELADDL